MSSRAIDEAERLRLEIFVHTLVGPAPWYARDFALPTGAAEWSWHDPQNASKTELLRRRKGGWDVVLRVPIYSRVIGLKGDLLAVWRPVDGVNVAVYRPGTLDPLGTTSNDASIESSSDPLEQVGLPVLRGGAHTGYRSTEIEVPELLFPIHSSDEKDPEAAAMTIYAWAPREGTLSVLPQRWFTDARYDTGYQWITRVGRDPQTGRIVGDGIRIGYFELDESGTDVVEFRGWSGWEWRPGTGPAGAERVY